MLVIVSKCIAANSGFLSFSGLTSHSASNSEKSFGIGVFIFAEITFLPEKYDLSGFGSNMYVRYSCQIRSSNFGFFVIFWSDQLLRIEWCQKIRNWYLSFCSNHVLSQKHCFSEQFIKH